jgi:hypothetical protein
VPADGARRRQHVLQVGRAILVRRRTHGDELDGAELHRFLNIGREMQPSGRHVAGHHLVKARLVDGNAPLLQDPDLLGIQVQAQHVVAHLGKTGPGHQTHVTRYRPR